MNRGKREKTQSFFTAESVYSFGPTAGGLHIYVGLRDESSLREPADKACFKRAAEFVFGEFFLQIFWVLVFFSFLFFLGLCLHLGPFPGPWVFFFVVHFWVFIHLVCFLGLYP